MSANVLQFKPLQVPAPAAAPDIHVYLQRALREWNDDLFARLEDFAISGAMLYQGHRPELRVIFTREVYGFPSARFA